jgi:hypothetical protein
MSALNTFQFNQNNWQSGGVTATAGPGMNTANLLRMGWLPTANMLNLQFSDDGTEQTLTVTALSHPRANVLMAIQVDAGNTPFDGNYVVEYRQDDGWDQGFLSSRNAPAAERKQGGAVFVHKDRSAGDPASTLIENGNSGALLPNDTAVLSTPGGITFHVTVKSIDRTNATATVAIGTGAN